MGQTQTATDTAIGGFGQVPEGNDWGGGWHLLAEVMGRDGDLRRTALIMPFIQAAVQGRFQRAPLMVTFPLVPASACGG